MLRASPMVLLIVLLLVHDSPSAFAAEDGEAAEASARAEEQMFESLQPPMPAHMLAGWRSGVAAYERFQHEFHRSTGGVLTPSAKAALLEAAEHLKPLAGYTLGAQREFILLGRLQDVHVPLARETAYCSEAAKWSLSRALSPLASNSYAVNESSETTLWNAGVSGAIGYYRRAGDFARAEAALKLARQHPSAATHYERLDQTPLIYYPGLPAHPWWESRRFSIVRSLEAAYAHPLTRARMMAELDQLILSDALQAILSPAAPLGTANATRAPVLPHCGITNRRLTMQFALRGSEGVEVIVGGEARGYGGDGRAIVFDDSFEHSVRHGGSRVRYVLYAVLRHPSVPRQAYG